MEKVLKLTVVLGLLLVGAFAWNCQKMEYEPTDPHLNETTDPQSKAVIITRGNSGAKTSLVE